MTRTWFESKDKQFDCQMIAVRLIDLAKNRGANIHPLLRGTGIFYEDLSRGNHYLSFGQLETLIGNALKQVNSQDLSFLVGRRLIPNTNQDISELLLNARSLGDLLRLIQCYQPLVFPFLSLTVKRYDGKTWLLVNNAVEDSHQQSFWYDVLCTAINATCKWHLGHQVPIHFYFQQKRPRNIYQYEENLGHRLCFEYPMNMLAIEDHWLDKVLINSSPMVRQRHRLQCQQALKKMPQKFGIIQYASDLIHRQNINNQEDLACAMNISPATLKRKLKLHGTSFQKLLDNVKAQTATFDLKIRGLTNEQAAKSLNFTNLPNFRRAIKRWTGLTPSELKTR